MRKIPKKNYLFVIIISICTIVLVYGLVNMYNKNTKLDFISEVKEKDLDDYIKETNNVLIYFSSSKKSKEFEKDFKEYLSNNEIIDNIIYVDLNETSKDFKKKFADKYWPKFRSSLFTIDDPTLVYISDGYITRHLYNINDINDVKKLIGDVNE